MKIRFHFVRHGFAVATSFALLILASPVQADPLQDISKMIRQGQHAQALEQADRYLASKPKDAQARFLKGIALTEMGRTNDAIGVFQKLTEDYPELPEPYNNLAVIYAQQKQYEKAKSALEMAIRTHPSYATAHENLGDIYARLASQAYDKALQLDSANASAQNKLGMIRELVTGNTRIASAKPASSKPATETTETKVAAKPEPKPEAKPEVKPLDPNPVVVAAATSTTTSTTTSAAKVEPAKADNKAPTSAAKANPDDVTKAVNQWAAAWARKDVKAYLAVYAKDFKTPNGIPRAKWEDERRSRIEKPGTIEVRLDQIKVTLDGDTAVVRFRQHYQAGAFKASASKSLDMVLRDGKWMIQQERVAG